MADIRIGISGWRYIPWRDKFYPPGLAQKNELHFASRCFNSIELNGSFYSLQRPSSYKQWYSETPDDFVFAVKGGRFITHMRRLKEIEEPLANFFASGVLALKEKLGPFLWQFPPNFKFDPVRFEAFFELLPKSTAEAVKLAGKHGKAITKSRRYVETDTKRPIRHAIEFRHESFLTDEFIKLLRKHNIALVFADTARKFPYIEDVTADFVYARLHGDEELYASGYSDLALDRWAQRIRRWHTGKQPEDARLVSKASPPKARSRYVYVYFDNDIKVHSPFDAMRLAQRLGLKKPGEACPKEMLTHASAYSGRSKPRRDRPRPTWGS